MNTNSLTARSMKLYRVCPMGGDRFAYMVRAPSIAHVVAWTRHYPAVIVRRVLPREPAYAWWEPRRTVTRLTDWSTAWPNTPRNTWPSRRHTWGFLSWP